MACAAERKRLSESVEHSAQKKVRLPDEERVRPRGAPAMCGERRLAWRLPYMRKEARCVMRAT